ncbi:MAG: hypothetical protein JXN61_06695, partial [Sedimentisphaerales bacterium]|nr:hypothetical protein [Sedimentisphaerales bacterium]
MLWPERSRTMVFITTYPGTPAKYGSTKHRRRPIRWNESGYIVQVTWYELSSHYPHIALDAFVVMPNHVHMIVVLTPPVGAGFKPALMEPTPAESAHARSVRTGPIRAGLKPAPTGKRHGLPEIVRAFKTFSARRVNARRA